MIDAALTRFVQEEFDPGMTVERHDTWLFGSSVLEVHLGPFKVSRAVDSIDRSLAQFDLERHVVSKVAAQLVKTAK